MRPSECFIEKTKQTGLYNIQAIDNVASIMQEGLLSNEKAHHISHTSIAMNVVQERRENIRVPNGLNLHQYANVYFDPHNPMLSARRSQNNSLCILKFDCMILDMRNKSVKCAEVLVPYCIPYDYVTCAAVVNDEAALKLENIGFHRKIEIFPQVFF